MKSYDDSISWDEEVYGVVFDDPNIGDIWMMEVARTEEEARTHWRFRANWLSDEHKRRTRVEKLTHRAFIEKVYSRSHANPFETLAAMEFLTKMVTKYGE